MAPLARNISARFIFHRRATPHELIRHSDCADDIDMLAMELISSLPSHPILTVR